MDDTTKLARSYLKSIPTRTEFFELIDELLISDIERRVIVGFYIEHKDMSIIANEIDYSIQYAKMLHKNVLVKVSNYIMRSKQIDKY